MIINNVAIKQIFRQNLSCITPPLLQSRPQILHRMAPHLLPHYHLLMHLPPPPPLIHARRLALPLLPVLRHLHQNRSPLRRHLKLVCARPHNLQLHRAHIQHGGANILSGRTIENREGFWGGVANVHSDGKLL